MYRSDNGGDSWQPVTAPPSLCGLAIAATDDDRLYARSCIGSDRPAVFRSDDGGRSWQAPTTTFTPTLDTLVVSPVDPNLLIATDFTQVFRSTDGGGQWTIVPIGTVYSGRPIFHPLMPHTLYLGTWNGLLRSIDDGQTWESSDIDRNFTELVASPYASDEMLGGSDEGIWRFTSNGNAWRATPWHTPNSLQWLGRSTRDGRILYARTETGLWRYVSSDPTPRFTFFLPAVSNSQSQSGSEDVDKAITRANLYRMRVGAMPLRIHPAIVAATQAHANYFLLNFGDQSAQAYGAHGEVDGKPGYTGRWPSDRIRAAGFPWFGGAEVMHFIGDPIASVDGWMATIYHRVITLDPSAHYTGYGIGRSDHIRVDVMDFGSGPTDDGIWASVIPYPLAYPAHEQTDVPFLWGGGEYPDPLPPGAARPVGFPFTLQGVRGSLRVDWAELRDGANQVVATHPSRADCVIFNCYALIAVAPLQPNTTYTVHARGAVGDTPFD
jgi:hypothetical protein